jgi:glycosyltransferase involved in cell wall biosynthesis
VADASPQRPVPATGDAPGEVLFLSPFFAPEMISTGKYNTYLVRGLADRGHHVSVVCSHPLYPDWMPEISDHREQGVTAYRGGAGIRYPRSTIARRLVLELWYAWHVMRTVRRLPARPPLVVAVFPPVLFALPLRWLVGRRAHIVGVVHDLLGIMATSSGGSLRRVVSRLIGILERAVLGRCDRVVALSGSMQDVLAERYAVPRERITVAYPFETLGELDVTTDALAQVLPEGERHVVYAGALGEKQRPDDLFALLREVAGLAPDVRCHIFSAGPAFEALRQRAARDHEARVHFHPLVPEAHLREMYERSSVQIIPQAPGTGAGAFPSKLPNLVAAGVPVFAICDEDSELAEVVRRSDAGRVVSTWDTASLARALADYLDAVAADPREARRARLAPFVAANFRVAGLLASLAADAPAQEETAP